MFVPILFGTQASGNRTLCLVHRPQAIEHFVGTQAIEHFGLSQYLRMFGTQASGNRTLWSFPIPQNVWYTGLRQ
jgi:hypothetical protein